MSLVSSACSARLASRPSLAPRRRRRALRLSTAATATEVGESSVAERMTASAEEAARDPLAMKEAGRRALEASARLLSKADCEALTAKYDFDVAEHESQRPALYAYFDELLGDGKALPRVGDTCTGTVYKVDTRGAFVDVGGKAPAYLPLVESAVVPPSKMSDVVSCGDELEFQVIQNADRDGMLALSLSRLELSRLWTRFRGLMAEDATVEGSVTSANRGGTLVIVEGLRGFVPTSHLSPHYKASELEEGAVLPLKFLEVDEERGRVVLSNRRAVAEQRAREYAVGDVVEGVVTSVKPYGAFVDVGATNGLLHISQISADRVSAVEAVLKPGDRLKVMVLSQDSERGRISLSTKKLEPSPGDMLRDPSLVYNSADEMAARFKERIRVAEEAAQVEEGRLSAEAASSAGEGGGDEGSAE